MHSPLVHVPQTGFWLDFSSMALPTDLAARESARVRTAFAEMAAVERGDAVNTDEGRRVGHYWLRAPERAPEPALTEAIEAGVEQVAAFAADVRAGRIAPGQGGRFTQLLLAGIGGSALGPQFVSRALAPIGDPSTLRLSCLDNTDPDGFDRALGHITAADGLARTLVLVVSKSGGTKETRNAMLECIARLEGAGLRPGAHLAAVTMPGSELDHVATVGNWLARFPMFDWVGGRTSELAAVGLLPAALEGIDIRALLAGARAMDEATRIEDADTNPALRLALAWWHATDGRARRAMVVLPYADRLELFPRYLQQLVMESLGKELDRAGRVVNQGIAVYGNKGSTDQHAYVQQLREGPDDYFATFVESLTEREGPARDVEPGITSGDYLFGFLEGTRQALGEKGHRSLTITVPRVDARTVGALIALYERAVGFYAAFAGINAYHQPGVEAGKKAAAAVLVLQQQVVAALTGLGGPASAAEIAGRIDGAEAGRVWRMLRRLAHQGRHGVRVHDGDGPDTRYTV